MPEQIVVLLALTEGLFDNIPIDAMHDAEAALLKSCAELPAEMLTRLYADYSPAILILSDARSPVCFVSLE